MRSLLWLGFTASLVACGSDDTTTTSGSGASSAGGNPTSSASTGSATTGSGGAAASGGGGGTASGGGSATGGSGGNAPCDPACAGGLECCNGICVNKGNDIKNCGTCGNTCPQPNPFCDNGACGKPPCGSDVPCSGATSCCGSECCATGMLCCVVPAGPVGPPTCVAPNANGTCEPGCPECVCAAPNTPVATPDGERPIADLVVGDLVYSVDRGVVKAVPITRVNRVHVEHHHVVRTTLANGAVLQISARHPTADGRSFADLRPGDELSGVAIANVALVAYPYDHTYDILPDSDSGAYFAGGALVGSTLKQDARRVPDGCYGLPR